jgi:enoyl-CoA hydratase/carnithine racemase
MVEGSVWGDATETVLACDLIVAAESATFAVTPAKLRVPYNVSGMLTFLNAAPLRIVKEMTFTGQPVGAVRAERFGMINYVLPAAELEGFTFGLARQIAANAHLSVAVMKEQLRILSGAHPMSPQGFERVQGRRKGGAFSGEGAAGLVLRARPPHRRGIGAQGREGRPREPERDQDRSCPRRLERLERRAATPGGTHCSRR